MNMASERKAAELGYSMDSRKCANEKRDVVAVADIVVVNIVVA